MVALLWDAGLVAAAVELEAMWNDLTLRHPFALFCGYRAASVTGQDAAGALAEVCRLHAVVITGGQAPSAWRADPRVHRIAERAAGRPPFRGGRAAGLRRGSPRR